MMQDQKRAELIAARQAIQNLNDARLACYTEILDGLNDDILNEAMSVIDKWEKSGLCWSRYIDGWRAILKSENPSRALANTGNMLNGFLQNSPLSFQMNKAPLEKYWNSLKG